MGIFDFLAKIPIIGGFFKSSKQDQKQKVDEEERQNYQLKKGLNIIKKDEKTVKEPPKFTESNKVELPRTETGKIIFPDIPSTGLKYTKKIRSTNYGIDTEKVNRVNLQHPISYIANATDWRIYYSELLKDKIKLQEIGKEVILTGKGRDQILRDRTVTHITISYKSRHQQEVLQMMIDVKGMLPEEISNISMIENYIGMDNIDIKSIADYINKNKPNGSSLNHGHIPTGSPVTILSIDVSFSFA